MTHRHFVWLPVVMLLGCGGSQTPAASPGPADQSATPAEASTTPAASKPAADTAASESSGQATPRSPEDQAADAKRAQMAAKAVEVLADPSVDKAMLPRSASVELSEAEYGLRAQVRKALAALGGARVDPSQLLTITRALVAEEPLGSTLQSLCGKPVETVVKDARALSAAARTGSALARCNQKPAEVLGNLDPSKVEVEAALLSVALLQVIEKRGGASEAEKKLVRMLAGLGSRN